MTEPATPEVDLTDQLEAALIAAQSPLGLAPYDPAELIDDEIALHDSRFGEDLTIRASRLEALLTDHSITDVAAGLENLSAAYAIAEQVESATWAGDQAVQGAHQGFTDKALTQGVVSLYAVEDELTVDLPVQAVTLVPPERIAGSAMKALNSEIDQATGTTFAERVEMDSPVGRQLEEGTLTTHESSTAHSFAFATGDPFDTGNPFTSPSAEGTEPAADAVASAEPEPEPEPGHSPGL